MTELRGLITSGGFTTVSISKRDRFRFGKCSNTCSAWYSGHRVALCIVVVVLSHLGLARHVRPGGADENENASR
jgi:hypothetical protein